MSFRPTCNTGEFAACLWKDFIGSRGSVFANVKVALLSKLTCAGVCLQAYLHWMGDQLDFLEVLDPFSVAVWRTNKSNICFYCFWPSSIWSQCVSRFSSLCGICCSNFQSTTESYGFWALKVFCFVLVFLSPSFVLHSLVWHLFLGSSNTQGF